MKTTFTIFFAMLFGMYAEAKPSVGLLWQEVQIQNSQTSLEGTYQIRVINARFKPAINSDHFKLIEESRKENEDVILKITENIEILVLSQAKISAGELIDENQRIIYVRR